jgi:DNA-binding transcriptional MerR regulator
MTTEANMLRIGQFARLGRVSVKTLRHYDAINLLKPSAVDRHSSYRYYEPRQLRRLQRILDLKSLGFSLESLRDMLEEDLDEPAWRETLLARKHELAQSIALQQELLADVEARLQALADGRARQRSEVRVMTTEPRQVASLRSPLSSYEEAEALFFDLERRLAPTDRQGPLGAIWHGCAHNRTIDCEAFVPIWDGLRLPRGLSGRELPGTTMASVFHFGSDTTHEDTYRAAREWIAARGRKVSGPNHEIYLIHSRGYGEEDDVTEIQFSLEGR